MEDRLIAIYTSPLGICFQKCWSHKSGNAETKQKTEIAGGDKESLFYHFALALILREYF